MRVLIAVASAAAVVLAACSSGTGPVAERTITIEMREFGYSPPTIKLVPGERVTFSFKNLGAVEHEFMAGREATMGKGYGQDWLALAKVEQGGGHDMGHAGTGVRVAPKGNVSVSLVVPAEKGEFEFGCFVPGHYELGMKGKLVVE